MRIMKELLALNPCKKYQIIYAKVHSYSCTCCETNTHAKVNLYEVLTYNSGWK